VGLTFSFPFDVDTLRSFFGLEALEESLCNNIRRLCSTHWVALPSFGTTQLSPSWASQGRAPKDPHHPTNEIISKPGSIPSHSGHTSATSARVSSLFGAVLALLSWPLEPFCHTNVVSTLREPKIILQTYLQNRRG